MQRFIRPTLRLSLSTMIWGMVVTVLILSRTTADAHQAELSTTEANSTVALNAPQNQNLTLEGTLSVRHIDPARDADLEYYNYVTLYTDDGGRYILDIPYGQVMQYTRQRVTVVGRNATTFTPQDADSYDGTIAVDMIMPASGVNERSFLETTTGSFKYINLLCRFADSTGEAPREPSYFDRLFRDTYPGLGQYFSNVSYGAVTLTADTVTRWYTLPQPSSFYTADGVNLDQLMNDCIAVADADVNYTDYDGITLNFDVNYASFAVGTPGTTLNLDGENRLWRVTWNPPLSWSLQYFIGHEIGHSLALPHSGGTRGDGENWPYDSFWDVMSGGGDNRKISDPEGVLGGLGPGTIAYYAYRVGWVPESRVVTVADKTRQTITLERLVDPVSPTHPLLIQIPINGSSRDLYTVELRQLSGYDEAIPREAALIHRVILDRGEDALARVVDADDGNTDDNDEGASWVVGETYTDPTHNISIEIISKDGSNYTIAVNNDAAADATDVPTETATATATDAPTETATATDAPTDIPGTGITRIYPTDGQNISTAADYKPQFQWAAVDGAEWYHVVIATPDYSTFLFSKWYEASSVCSGDVCTMSDIIWLNVTGPFEFWMTYWSTAVGDAYVDNYTKTDFTISMTNPTGISEPGISSSSEGTQFAFTADPNALWYQAWVGPNTYTDGSVVYDWYAAADICSAGTCTIPGTYTLDGATTYEWWMELWGPGGYVEWVKIGDLVPSSRSFELSR